MVKLEIGKYYKTRDGRKVGPCELNLFNTYEFPGDWVSTHNADGTYNGYEDGLDIVSEWYTTCVAAQVDVQRDEYGPIRTRREIVPGTYGVVTVEKDGSGTFAYVECASTAEELREAAHTFNQLAEALNDNRA